MRPEAAAREIRDALVGRGFRRDRTIPGSLRYLGSVAAGGREIAIAVEFPSIDFAVLPRIVVLNRARDLPGRVAHLEYEGGLCYAAAGSIVLDRYRPGEAAITSLELAIATLENIIGDAADGDVVREFPQHWQGAELHVALCQGTREGPADLFTLPRHEGDLLVLLTRKGRGLDAFAPDAKAAAEASRRPAWVARTDRALDLPAGMTLPATFAGFLEWAAACDPGLEGRLLRAAQGFFRQIPSLFVLAPNGCVGADLVVPSIIARAVQRAEFHARVMDRSRERITLSRWSGRSMDTDFMFDRNMGGDPGLAGRSVVLAGCGTIGSHLAKFLAQSGAGHQGRLVVVDPNVLRPGNVGRHWLGPGHVGLRKAMACRDELRRMFPGSDVSAESGSILDYPHLLERADLVVDVTGEEAVSLALNEALVRRRPNAPDAIYAWLAGNGAAAQVLLVTGGGIPGACLKCLRPSLQEQRAWWPMRGGDGVAEVAVACGEAAFVPYGVAASAIAAGLAMRMCLDWARGRADPTLRTLRVDTAATVALDDLSPAPEPGCPACGSRL